MPACCTKSPARPEPKLLMSAPSMWKLLLMLLAPFTYTSGVPLPSVAAIVNNLAGDAGGHRQHLGVIAVRQRHFLNHLYHLQPYLRSRSPPVALLAAKSPLPSRSDCPTPFAHLRERSPSPMTVTGARLSVLKPGAAMVIV